MARSKTLSSRKIQKPRRISFPRFSTSGFSFCTIPKSKNSELKTSEFSLRHFDKFRAFPTPSFPFFTILKTQNSELKTSEFSLRHYDQTPRISNSELSILHHTENGKLGVFSEVYPTTIFFNLIVHQGRFDQHKPVLMHFAQTPSFSNFQQLPSFVFALYLKPKTRR